MQMLATLGINVREIAAWVAYRQPFLPQRGILYKVFPCRWLTTGQAKNGYRYYHGRAKANRASFKIHIPFSVK